MHPQDQVYAQSVTDPESFWRTQAEGLHWHKNPQQILKKYYQQSKDNAPYPKWTWFPDGEISTSYNCIERHVKAGHGASTAIAWDSPATKSKEQISYSQLLDEVETFAAVLRDQGVRKGDGK